MNEEQYFFLSSITFFISLLSLFVLSVINVFTILGFYEATLYDTRRQGYDIAGNETDSPTPYRVDFIIENKNILSWLKLGTENWPYWIKKPLYDCTTCMASLHSVYVYWPVIYFTDISFVSAIYIYAIYILLTAGISNYVARSMERN